MNFPFRKFLALSMCLAGVALAEPPLSVEAINDPFMGIAVGLENPLAEGAAANTKQKAGLYVQSILYASPTLGKGAALKPGDFITQVNGIPVESPVAFSQAIKQNGISKDVVIEVSEASLGRGNRVTWGLKKKREFPLITRGQWSVKLMTARKDSFLTEWQDFNADGFRGGSSPRIPPEDLVLQYQMKDGRPFNLTWSVAVHDDFWLFVDRISVRVGEAVYELPVAPERIVLKDASVLESMQGKATGDAMKMIQDVAFGEGEVAVQFHGRSSNVAKPMTALGQLAFRTVAMAYIQSGGLDLMPVGAKVLPLQAGDIAALRDQEAKRQAEMERRIAAGEVVRPPQMEAEPPARSRGDEELANSQLKLARQYIKNSKRDKAREILEKLVADYPESAAATEARQELERLK